MNGGIFTTSEFINLEAEIEYILVFTSGYMSIKFRMINSV